MNKTWRIKKLLLFSFIALTLRTLRAEEEIASPLSAYETHRQKEMQWIKEGIFVLPHKPSYFLPFTYDTHPNTAPFDEAGQQGQELDRVEAKFQISFKILLNDYVHQRLRLFFGYTQLSMWQLYNKSISAPFRDTNYEPEVFLDYDTNQQIGPFRNRMISLGMVHQSNGREKPLSRSWNRVYANFLFDAGDFAFNIKPWYRIPESSENDDNPDIYKYMGYGEFRIAYAHRQKVYSMMLRNNLRLDGNKGAIELGMSFRMTRILRGYIQYFNGYGECLLDYNDPSNRIGVGISISDWL